MPQDVPARTESLDGPALREAFASGTAWLEAQVEYVNSLNVFPVPDGDTGTNLLLTMRSALAHADNRHEAAGAMADALARGALLGARGNAGVIFSQIMRGFHRGVEDRERVTSADLPEAFSQASAHAYRAVSKPVEGTILTVIREVADSLHQGNIARTPLPAAFELAAATAKEWVQRTPDLMPLLKENGVVDSGAQGLAIILDGMSRYVNGDRSVPAMKTAVLAQRGHEGLHNTPPEFGQRYGFCTEFFIERSSQDVETIRRVFQAQGSSVMVAGDSSLVKVHLHTLDPEGMFSKARSFGILGATKVEDMDAQHLEWRRKRTAAVARGRTGVVAVAAGEGLEDLFRSLGVSAVIPGGQTMNPSAEEILSAINSVSVPEVIVLPNNKNVVLAARQAKALAADKNVIVVPTEDIPQGVTAMIGFNYDLGAEENAEAMEEARSEVKTAEVSRAARPARLEGRAIAPGDVIGLIGGKLVAAGHDLTEAVLVLLDRLQVPAGSTVTLYYGGEVDREQAGRTREAIKERFPDAEVEAVFGGQPHYAYLIAVE